MLRTRLYLGLLPLLLVLVATGVYAIRVCRELAGPLQRDLVADYRAALGCQEMRTSATLMSNSLAVVSAADPIAARRDLDTHRAAFSRELMDQSASSAGKPRGRLVDGLDAAFQDYSARCDRMLAGGGSASLADIRADEDALYRVLSAIDRISASDYAASQETELRAERLANSAVRVLSVAIGAAVALSAVLAWLVAASLLRPIKALTASAIALGEGNLDTRAPEFSRDELGSLARSFNTMAARLREYREATLARVLRTQRTMEATLTSAPDPLFVISKEGKVEVRNPAAEELSKLPEFSGGLPAALAEPLASVLATDEHYLPTDYERVATFRVGSEDRHYLPRILAIGDKLTEFKGAALILQDVTKFRLLDDAKTNLVGTVSHELKTPLTGLRMAVYLLLENTLGPLTPAQREMLESARDDADRLLRILDSLLDLTRLEAGASALERRRVPVDELLRGIEDEARSFISAAGQQLVVRVEPGLGAVNVDPGRLRHVFINLLSNASKYSPAAGTIALGATPAPLGFVRFSVRDDGGGIPPEALPRIFDRFYRVPGQSKPGAGIGLAIAREIVVAHGGSIACSSTPGGGTEFHFLLPAA
ncbi:MAG TPA: ATP-binding protein [Opitutaceae bacterium]|nr:ATP-binding protein [Opitutaceae bacterium]